MDELLGEKGSNLWAERYDLNVEVSDGENTFSFAEYKSIVGRIFRIVMEKRASLYRI